MKPKIFLIVIIILLIVCFIINLFCKKSVVFYSAKEWSICYAEWNIPKNLKYVIKHETINECLDYAWKVLYVNEK